MVKGTAKGAQGMANKGKGKVKGKDTDWWGSMETELHWVMQDRARTVEPMPPPTANPTQPAPIVPRQLSPARNISTRNIPSTAPLAVRFP
jgi:hypothetical protein